MKLPGKSFKFISKDTTIQMIKNDEYSVMPPNEISRLRKVKILKTLDIEKLNNALNKGAKGKRSYSDKEMTDMLITLGENVSGLKASHVSALLRLKSDFDSNN